MAALRPSFVRVAVKAIVAGGGASTNSTRSVSNPGALTTSTCERPSAGNARAMVFAFVVSPSIAITAVAGRAVTRATNVGRVAVGSTGGAVFCGGASDARVGTAEVLPARSAVNPPTIAPIARIPAIDPSNQRFDEPPRTSISRAVLPSVV